MMLVVVVDEMVVDVVSKVMVGVGSYGQRW